MLLNIFIATLIITNIDVSYNAYNDWTEILRWIPPLQCVSIHHIDYVGISKAKVFEAYGREYLDDLNGPIIKYIKEKMKLDLNSITIVITSKIKIKELRENEHENISRDNMLIIVKYYDAGYTENDIERENIVDRYYNNIIYEIDIEDRKYVIYITKNEILLMSTNIHILKRMIRSGMLIDANIMDDEYYHGILTNECDLGQKWSINFTRKENEQRLEEESIKFIDNSKYIESWIQYEVIKWYFGEEIEYERNIVFGDCAEAEKYYKQEKEVNIGGRYENIIREYNRIERGKTKRMLDKCRITIKVRYDKELIESENRMRKELEKAKSMHRKDNKDSEK